MMEGEDSYRHIINEYMKDIETEHQQETSGNQANAGISSSARGSSYQD